MQKQEYFTSMKCHKLLVKIDEILHNLKCNAVPKQNKVEKLDWLEDQRKNEFKNYPKIPQKYKKEIFYQNKENEIFDQINKNEDLIKCPKCSKTLFIDEIEDHTKNCEKHEFKYYPKIPEKYKKEYFNQNKENENIIKCPKCYKTLIIDEVEDHIKNCDYENCLYCNHFFPKQIIDQHFKYCDKIENKVYALENNGSFDSDSRHDGFRDSEIRNSDHQLVTNEFFMNQNRGEQLVTSELINQNNGGQLVTSELIESIVINTNQSELFESIVINTNQNNNRNPDGLTTIEIIETNPQGINRTSIRVQNYQNQNQNQNLPNWISYVSEHENQLDLIPTRIQGDFYQQNLEELQNNQTGMNRNSINRIKKIKFKKKNIIKGEEEQCTICITEYENKEVLKELSCKHLFHPKCIDIWLVQKNSCPICKKVLSLIYFL